jgi:3-oxoacyl-[acyl-carrier-protein] synthase II
MQKDRSITRRRVVVTGLGAATPVGVGCVETWAGLTAGRSGIGPIKRFDVTDCPVKIAGEVDPIDFTAPRYNLFPRGADGPEVTAPLGPKDGRKFGRFTHLGMFAGMEAYADSGLDSVRDSVAADRIGVNIGVGLGGLPEIEDAKESLREKGYRKVSPFFILQSAPNILSGQAAIALNLTGPNYSVASACATGGHSLGEALRTIQRGEADIMLSGGSESTICPLAIGSFAQMRALSTRNDDPEKA